MTMYEIYAHLLILSLTALVVNATSEKFKLKTKVVPGFKNATEVLRRHLYDCVNSKNISAEVINNIIDQTAKILWVLQPKRSYLRISKTPPSKWSVSRGRRRNGYMPYKKKTAA